MKRYLLPTIFIALFAIASYFIYQKIVKKELPPNLVMGVGQFDADIYNINTKYPGRVETTHAKEGEKITKGQLLAQISSKELIAQKEAIVAQIEAKKVELSIEEASLPQNVKKAYDALQGSKNELAALKDKIDSLKALVAQDQKDLKRLRNLYFSHLVSKRKVELASLKLTTDSRSLQALKDEKRALLTKIEAAKSTLLQAKSTLRKIDVLKHAIEALRAKKSQIEAMISELSIKSPINGIVLDQIAHTGEVVGAGMPMYTAYDPKELYLKIFVDTIETGKIKIGDEAVIFLDAYPNRPFRAKVTYIAQKAEFTPKEVAVRSDRIQRVYEIHLRPLKPSPLFKLGLPATGVVSLDGKGLPKSLKEVPEL